MPATESASVTLIHVRSRADAALGTLKSHSSADQCVLDPLKHLVGDVVFIDVAHRECFWWHSPGPFSLTMVGWSGRSFFLADSVIHLLNLLVACCETAALSTFV
jgi:hypothetical protein